MSPELRSRGRGKKIVLLLGLAVWWLTAGAAAQTAPPRPPGPAPGAETAAPAPPPLHRGMSPQEVRAVLGEPDDLISFSGPGRRETWKYCPYPDCGQPLGIRVPITEVVFVDGRLQKWTTYKQPPEPPAAPQRWEEQQPVGPRNLPGS